MHQELNGDRYSDRAGHRNCNDRKANQGGEFWPSLPGDLYRLDLLVSVRLHSSPGVLCDNLSRCSCGESVVLASRSGRDWALRGKDRLL